MSLPIIEVHGLHKVYKGLFGNQVHALRGVDLTLEPGQAFGLLGPNGAGKTTLIKILLGLVHPTSGDVRLLGADAGQPAARRRIGYMPELRNYPTFMTAAHCLDLFGRLHGLTSSDRVTRIDQVLAEVDLSQWRDHKVGGFSKGMKQRLALAQALMNDPELLFLDEPAEGIDPLGRVVFRNILRRAHSRGTTLFVNSHLLTEVEMVCDQVAILHAGRVVESGVLSELTSREREYRVTVASNLDQVPQVLDGSVEAIEEGRAPEGLAAWHLTVHDREQLNAALDRIRRADILIDGVEPVRSSLEEVFILAVGGADSETESASEVTEPVEVAT